MAHAKSASPFLARYHHCLRSHPRSEPRSSTCCSPCSNTIEQATSSSAPSILSLEQRVHALEAEVRTIEKPPGASEHQTQRLGPSTADDDDDPPPGGGATTPSTRKHRRPRTRKQTTQTPRDTPQHRHRARAGASRLALSGLPRLRRPGPHHLRVSIPDTAWPDTRRPAVSSSSVNSPNTSMTVTSDRPSRPSSFHQHHHQRVTQPLLLEQLRQWGVDISAGQLSPHPHRASSIVSLREGTAPARRPRHQRLHPRRRHRRTPSWQERLLHPHR